MFTEFSHGTFGTTTFQWYLANKTLQNDSPDAFKATVYIGIKEGGSVKSFNSA
jgi:hypothetical protein